METQNKKLDNKKQYILKKNKKEQPKDTKQTTKKKKQTKKNKNVTWQAHRVRKRQKVSYKDRQKHPAIRRYMKSHFTYIMEPRHYNYWPTQ